MNIQYFEVTGMAKTAYYAGYSLDDVKLVAYSDCNSQKRLFFTQIREDQISPYAFIESAQLSLEDAHHLIKKRITADSLADTEDVTYTEWLKDRSVALKRYQEWYGLLDYLEENNGSPDDMAIASYHRSKWKSLIR